MTDSPRRCPICTRTLQRNVRESAGAFAVRRFCGRPCASAARSAKYDKLLRGGKAPEPGPKVSKPSTLPDRHCRQCGDLLMLHLRPGGRLESEIDFAKRSFCSRQCGSRWGAAHAAMPSTPPEPITISPRGVALTTPKKHKAWPTADPSLCVHAAKPIWKSDGDAICDELHAHAPICASLVRGFASTVAQDAEGFVVPRFETRAGAKLWDSIADYRLGRNERRAA